MLFRSLSWQEKQRGEGFESGIYHLTATGETSRYGFAQAIVQQAHLLEMESLRSKVITPIPAADYHTAAKRPINSRLAVGRIEQRFGVVMPPWEMALHRCMKELV